jgi:hypothetical protein
VADRRYVPALRFRSLNRVYDPVVRLTTREADFKRRLLDQANGALPAVFEQGGLEHAAETDRLRTMFGTLALYRAQAPGVDDGDG